MEATKILNADLLDILFDNKNKDYGAYNLRRTYNKRITTALLITAGITALLFIATFVANSLGHKEKAGFDIPDVTIVSISQDPENQESKNQ